MSSIRNSINVRDLEVSNSTNVSSLTSLTLDTDSIDVSGTVNVTGYTSITGLSSSSILNSGETNTVSFVATSSMESLGTLDVTGDTSIAGLSSSSILNSGETNTASLVTTTLDVTGTANVTGRFVTEGGGIVIEEGSAPTTISTNAVSLYTTGGEIYMNSDLSGTEVPRIIIPRYRVGAETSKTTTYSYSTGIYYISFNNVIHDPYSMISNSLSYTTFQVPVSGMYLVVMRTWYSSGREGFTYVNSSSTDAFSTTEFSLNIVLTSNYISSSYCVYVQKDHYIRGGLYMSGSGSVTLGSNSNKNQQLAMSVALLGT